MNEIKDAKAIYDGIEIPKELDKLVSDSIFNYSKITDDMPKSNKRRRTGRNLRQTTMAAAAVLICFISALNLSETFAKAASNIPVLGGIARVLTIRSYQTSNENMNISVKVPEISKDNPQVEQDKSEEADIIKDSITDNNYNQEQDSVQEGDNEQFLTEVNTEIDKIVNDYLKDAKSRMQADKEAYIATGGTEEDWAERDLNINVDYEVKYQQGNLLSLVLSTDESWYGAYDLKYYYNIDLSKNTKLTLEDVLGKDYKEIANASIIDQMKKIASEDLNMVYWGITANDKSGIDGFKTVDENTKFYMNEQGKPVVCYDKYEIAPGFMGAQEFVIE